jgi:hypothetical protein
MAETLCAYRGEPRSLLSEAISDYPSKLLGAQRAKA